MPDDRCSIRGRPQPQPRSFDAATVQAGRLIGKMSKSLADDWRMKILKARLVKGTAFFLGQQNLSSLATALPRKSLQPRFSCAHPQLSNIEFCARPAPWDEHARGLLPFVELRRSKGRLIRCWRHSRQGNIRNGFHSSSSVAARASAA